MIDLTVNLEDRPGTLADMSEALGKADINMEGFCGFVCEDKGVGHILVKDAAEPRRVLEEAGFEVSDEREVLVLKLENKPGVLGGVCRRIANAGVNIEIAYVSDSGVVIGVDDLDKARSAL